MNLRFWILILSFLLTATTQAGVFVVDDDGPADFDSVQEAIDSEETADGSVIVVMPGLYVENIDFRNKVLVIRSSDPTDPIIVETTILDGGGAGRVVTCETNENAGRSLSGFTIRNGDAFDGGGILCNESAINISNCLFINNSALQHGGGIYFYRTTALCTVTECLFSENASGSFGGGINSRNSDVSFTECTFKDCTSPRGGGARVSNSDAAFLRCVFLDNTAESGGGLLDAESVVTLTECLFENNQATKGDGGGLNCIRGQETLVDCVFRTNAASGRGGGFEHVGLVAPGIERCDFEGNTAGEHGGGLSLDLQGSGFMGGLFIFETTFRENVAKGEGGGVFARSAPLAEITGCHFEGNQSVSGGGVSGLFSALAFIDCEFAANHADGPGGAIGGLHRTLAVTAALTRFYGNSSGENGGALFVEHVSLEQCDFEKNIATGFGGAIHADLFPVNATDTRFARNVAGMNGGAVSIAINTESSLYRCEFVENTGTHGGAIFKTGSRTLLCESCAVIDNNASLRGGGLAITSKGIARITNCTVAGNSAPEGGGVSVDETSIVVGRNSVIYENLTESLSGLGYEICRSIVEGGALGPGNSGDDPLFVSPETGDYRLLPGSPAIDAGDSAALLDGIDRDVAGDLRYIDDVSTPDTGPDGAPHVDLGAYEFQGFFPCRGDCDLSGSIAFNDLVAMLFVFGSPDASCDTDASGTVEFNDLVAALFEFGDCLTDCNENGIDDLGEIRTGQAPDCNATNRPDACDIAMGYSPDCNGNGIPDSCDIAIGTSEDCDGNGRPDECDYADDELHDLNANGAADECEIAYLSSPISGSTVSSLTPTLVWCVALDGTVALLVDDHPGFFSPEVIEIGVNPAGQFTVPTGVLAPGTLYYWRISVDTVPTQTNSVVSTFTTPLRSVPSGQRAGGHRRSLE